MDGKASLIVLGAGASYCYEDGHGPVPVQRTLLQKTLMQGDTNPPSRGFPTVVGSYGMDHSFELGEFLRRRFDLPETEAPNSKMDYWTRMHALGLNLESLYGLLEVELADRPDLLGHFESIVRTAVTAPCGERQSANTCRHYRALVERLEPGDAILSFNWDPLLPDALLRHSHFWFPSTGFGIRGVYPVVNEQQKRLGVGSDVVYLAIHGCVSLFEMVQEDESQPGRFLYLGPQAGNSLGSMIQLARQREGGVEHPTMASLKDDDMRKFDVGWIHTSDHWFRPLFVPPTRKKGAFALRYAAAVRRVLYVTLLNAQRILVAGYSFPDTDLDYLRLLFLPELVQTKADISVINPQNESEEFRALARLVFGRAEIDFAQSDFRKFCAGH